MQSALKALRGFWSATAAPFLAPFLPWILAAAGALLVLTFASTIGRWAVGIWMDARAERKAEKIERRVEEATPGIVRRGTEQVIERYRDETRIDREIIRDTKIIREAPGADTPVPDAFAVELRRALCLRNVYRDDPGCNMFRDGAGGVAGGRAGSAAAASQEPDGG